MGWQIGALIVLGAALVAGFTWYERTHPTSRMLALVATLAALAALGRIAFAPLPNVKPTTDIVLIAGFALGAAPGFVVGAIAALASNLVFGQGPWTPWQMVAWGLCGVLGAVLGRLDRAPDGAGPARAGMRRGGPRVRRDHGRLRLGHLRRRAADARPVPRDLRDVAPVQPRACGRERRLLPGLRAGPRARAAALPRSARGALGRSGAERSAGRLVTPLALLARARRRRVGALCRRAAARASGGGRRGRVRRRGLADARAERGRRLGRRARRALERRADRLDRDRARGLRPQAVARSRARALTAARCCARRQPARADRRRRAAQRARARGAGPLAAAPAVCPRACAAPSA